MAGIDEAELGLKGRAGPGLGRLTLCEPGAVTLCGSVNLVADVGRVTPAPLLPYGEEGVPL